MIVSILSVISLYAHIMLGIVLQSQDADRLRENDFNLEYADSARRGDRSYHGYLLRGGARFILYLAQHDACPYGTVRSNRSALASIN